MKIMNIFKKFWNDNVIGSVISSIIYSLIFSLFGLLTSKIPVIKEFFLQSISLHMYIILIFVFFIVFLFVSIIKRYKHLFSTKDKEITKLCNNIEALEKEINELKKVPDNPRMNLFAIRDTVIIKGSEACFSPVEYTVVNKTKDSIIIVDNKGESKTISPNALLTTEEYYEEKDKQKREFDMVLNRNKSGYDPFNF